MSDEKKAEAAYTVINVPRGNSELNLGIKEIKREMVCALCTHKISR